MVFWFLLSLVILFWLVIRIRVLQEDRNEYFCTIIDENTVKFENYYGSFIAKKDLDNKLDEWYTTNGRLDFDLKCKIFKVKREKEVEEVVKKLFPEKDKE